MMLTSQANHGIMVTQGEILFGSGSLSGRPGSHFLSHREVKKLKEQSEKRGLTKQAR